MSMKLGQAEAGGEAQLGKRDAFHVAAVLVKSEQEVYGGNHVRFMDDSFTVVGPSDGSNQHGIVDPFLDLVRPGVLFWVLLMPDLAHSLHHQFELHITDVPADDGEWNCQGCQ